MPRPRVEGDDSGSITCISCARFPSTRSRPPPRNKESRRAPRIVWQSAGSSVEPDLGMRSNWPFRKNAKMPASAQLPHGSWHSLPSQTPSPAARRSRSRASGRSPPEAGRRAKAGNSHVFPLCQRLADRREHGVDRAFGGELAQPHPAGHTADNLRFVHPVTPRKCTSTRTRPVPTCSTNGSHPSEFHLAIFFVPTHSPTCSRIPWPAPGAASAACVNALWTPSRPISDPVHLAGGQILSDRQVNRPGFSGD